MIYIYTGCLSCGDRPMDSDVSCPMVVRAEKRAEKILAAVRVGWPDLRIAGPDGLLARRRGRVPLAKQTGPRDAVKLLQLDPLKIARCFLANCAKVVAGTP